MSLLQVGQLEAELGELKKNSTAHYEKRDSTVREQEGKLSAMQQDISTLKEALQKEELEKLRKEQTVQEFKKKVKSLESHQHGLEMILREKQETEIECDRKLKHLKQKAHKLSEKVYKSVH